MLLSAATFLNIITVRTTDISQFQQAVLNVMVNVQLVPLTITCSLETVPLNTDVVMLASLNTTRSISH